MLIKIFEMKTLAFSIISLFFVLGSQLGNPTITQTNFSSLTNASNLLLSLNPEQRILFHRDFDDPRRQTWDRLPMKQEGLNISQLNLTQKQFFHRLLQSCLSTEGYLLVTTIMFNEGLQQKVEPNLGRNEYWIELFGTPNADQAWGFQLEGNHLSLNFTFQGDKMISHTPFLIGSNPQVINTDDHRNGMSFIYQEEILAGEVVKSFNQTQKQKGYTTRKQPNKAYGEIYRDALQVPDEGIYLSDLESTQLEIIQAILEQYYGYFRIDPTTEILQIIKGDTRFFFMEETAYNGIHYFRIENAQTLIECENYGNNTHHLWRTTNDFGKQAIN